MGERVDITLACSECSSRNYHSTRRRETQGPVEMKKYCRTCDKHTLHRETK